MTFSVIVPFLNEEPYIENCIRSLLKQDFGCNEYEIIFVDNGSTDRSAEIVRRYAEIKFLKETRQSAFIARNKALKIAKGDIIVFIDADCVAEKNWLKTIWERMKDPDIAMVLGKTCIPPDFSCMIKMIADYDHLRIKYMFEKCYPRNCFAYTRNMAVRSSMFKDLGPFIELHVGADTEFMQRCISRSGGMKAIYLPEAQIAHLEMTNIWIWLKKNFIYARSNIFVTKVSDYVPADYKINLEIFRRFMTSSGYSAARKMLLLAVLMLSDIFYKTGMVVGFVRLKAKMAL